MALTAKTSTWAELAAKFGVKENTLRAYAIRNKWPCPSNVKRAVQKAQKQAIAESGVDWLQRGEKQREIAWKLAHGALKKKKSLPVRNWKDAETADKMARRAAGLENDNPISQTLISINERINSAGGDDDEVLEAVIVEEEQPPTLEDTPAIEDEDCNEQPPPNDAGE